jgi:hypothetical protein
MEWNDRASQVVLRAIDSIRDARKDPDSPLILWEGTVADARRKVSRVLGRPVDEVEDDGEMPWELAELLGEIQIFEDQCR